MFEENDKDLDGKLSWEEFCGKETKNEKAFKLMDMDNSGKVSKDVSSFIWRVIKTIVSGISEILPKFVNQASDRRFQKV